MTVETEEVQRGIGTRLRTGREAAGLTILQAAERLHVDPRVLESLEAENFAALGAPVYARGHLRHYAELVGESATELSSLYTNSTHQEQQPDLTRIPKAPAPQDSNRLILPTLIILSIFALAGAVWWVLSLSAKKPAADRAAAQNPPGVTTPLAMDGTEGVAALPSAGGRTGTSSGAVSQAGGGRAGTSPGAASPAATSSTVTSAQTSRPTASSTSSPASAPQRLAAVAASPGTAASPATAAAAPAGQEPHSTRDAQLTLRYSADSWTEVYDAGGRRLFYEVGRANSQKSLSGTAPLRVVLGNASGVSVEINGQGVSVTKWSQPDGSAQFLISRSGRILRARPARTGG